MDARRGAPGSRPPGDPDRLHTIIAIDGAAGTGKSTTAALVAQRLGFGYVDSGAIYRALALALQEAGIQSADDPGLPAALARIPLRIRPEPSGFRVILGERELQEEIRSPEISNLASRLAVRAEVRERVRILLREAARRDALVVEGRDIGTVVFPEASFKVFLTAELSVRARRRRSDLKRQGRDQVEAEVALDLARRDRRDAGRAEAPLRQAPDAVVVDTGKTDIEGQVRAILDLYKQRMKEAPRDPRDRSGGSGAAGREGDPGGKP